jgi:DNA-binding IclR family transcriptional regulator
MSGLHSLEKVIRILDLFNEDRLEWTPEEMMAALGYTRPTLYRYLKVLREAGLLTALPETGFTLGPRVVEMDYLMRKSDPLLSHGADQLVELSSIRPSTALLVRWYGNRLLCVASDCSTPNPLSSYARGRPMPLTRGAISRAIIAFLPRRQQMAMVQERLPEFRELGLGETVDMVGERLRETRKVGYSVAFGEVTPGVVGIAAPVFDSAKSPIAALCVTVAQTLIDPAETPRLGDRVKAAADTISLRLEIRRGACARAAE